DCGGHARASNGKISCASLRAANSQNLSSISIPIALRPRFFAATSVVPEPMKGSSTSRSLHQFTSHETCSSLRGHGCGVSLPLHHGRLLVGRWVPYGATKSALVDTHAPARTVAPFLAGGNSPNAYATSNVTSTRPLYEHAAYLSHITRKNGHSSSG